MAETRTIHTGLYSDRAFKILNALLSAAIVHHKTCKRTMNIRSLCAMKCERNIDNEVVFTGKFEQWRFSNIRVFKDMSDERVLNHLAWIFKNMFLMKAVNQIFVFNRDNTPKDFKKQFWNRKNTDSVNLANTLEAWPDSLAINASEVYYLYEHMKNRKRLDMHYAAELIEQMVGVSLDPITVEMKNTINTEIQHLEEERERKLTELYNQKQNEIKVATDTIRKKFDELTTKMHNEYHTKILALKDEINALITVEANV